MGLTREYLRYAACGKFNIIASSECNVVFVTYQGMEGRFMAVGACEDVIIWDLRLQEKALVLKGDKSEVTRLCASPVRKHLAVGYADGSIKVFNMTDSESTVSFVGHKSAITCLRYDWNGHRLVSGSKDTDVIVWDVVAESGLHRLCGHRGVITEALFHGPDHPSLLITSSKDTFVKFWDLDTQHCFKTLVGHRTEVWGMSIVKDGKYLVTGCGDSELRVWKLNFIEGEMPANEETSASGEFGTIFSEEDSDSSSTYPLRCIKAGSILRKSVGRVISLTVDATGFILGCHGADTRIETFRFREEDESTHKAKNRLRKERKKASKEGELQQPIVDDKTVEVTLKDEVVRLPVVSVPNNHGKVKSISLVMGKGGELRIAAVLRHNILSLYSLNTSEPQSKAEKEEFNCLGSISLLGHRSEVRTLCFSSDSLAVISASSEAIKLWNRPSLTCLRTVTGDPDKSGKVSTLGYVLSACFVPGDRHAIIGMRDGRLLIADIGAGDILEEIPGHSKEVWSICLSHDQRGCISGGGDSTVRFWSFELIEDKKNVDEKAESTKGKVLSLFNTRALKVEESVLCVSVTPNGRFIAVALLDSTVKIFFLDTLKFFLSLYGHKLPVSCMDVSWDSKLIATGGGDRNVKIWGLDFGDCHRSLFAHDDTITSIKFVPKTHLFFTCGRDGRVKQWDADTFVKIITLSGHRGEAWALSVSPNGNFVVSAGSDRVLRLWEKTDEPLVLEDQEEVEREEETTEKDALVTGESTVVPGQHGSNLPSRKTVGSEKAAEQVIEALEVYEDYKSKLNAYKETCKAMKKQKNVELPPPPAVPLLMAAYRATCPHRFLIETIGRIRSSDLEEALLLLPFPWVTRLLEASPDLIIHSGPEVELICRAILFLDLTGYNLHGLEFVQREIELREGIQLFRDATFDKKDRDKRRKRKEKAIKRAI
ncbi:hypothetical protein J437_LFUL007857, partial [Ladona fulva]